MVLAAVCDDDDDDDDDDDELTAGSFVRIRIAVAHDAVPLVVWIGRPFITVHTNEPGYIRTRWTHCKQTLNKNN